MIRLIASDMDGTLLEPDGRLPEGVFDVIKRLKELGILFAAASGRQHDNLYRLFSPVAQDMCFICENGGLNAVGRDIVSINPFERATALEIINTLKNYGLDVLLSGMHCCYTEIGSRAFCDDMVYRLRNTMAIVERLEGVDDTFLKISAYCESGIAPFAPRLEEKWGARVNAAISGGQWFDFTVANKGMGVAALMRRYGLNRDEVAAFGDNGNDASMFRQAGHPFVMQNADPGLRKPGVRACEKVLPVLRAIAEHRGELVIG